MYNTFSAEEFGIQGNGTSDDTSALRAMVDSLPEKATVVMPPEFNVKLTAPVVLPRPLYFRNGKFKASPNGSTFIVQADDIIFDGTEIVGPDTWNTSINREHVFIGTPQGNTKRYYGLEMNRVKISKCQGVAMRFDFVSRFNIDKCTIIDSQYAGVQVISAEHGNIMRNYIDNVVMGGSLINAYGIAVTDSQNTEETRSRHVRVDGNTVMNVRGWEGIDSHAGEGIIVTRNTVIGCRTGIALVVGNNTRLLAPEGCIVSDNYIEYGEALPGGSGITLAGRQDGFTRWASGAVGVNVIRGYDKDVSMLIHENLSSVLLPQASDSPSSKSPAHPQFRTWEAAGSIVVNPGSVSASGGVTYPAGFFTSPPVVQITKASGMGARFVPYVSDNSATGVRVGFYDPSGRGNNGTEPLNIPYNLSAAQNNTSNSGRGVPYV